ncbi:hypothetical protein, partial [Scytonema sp. PCC 10023]|uniref:hypothetical protein n=1 Tax=Scytonema sp. PCC 10023 TaxID=1680591 RepID=UPI0039C63420
VVPTPDILTPVEQSDVPNHVTIEAQTTQSFQPSVSDVPNNSTTQTQTTQPSQPSQHKPTASTSQQIPKVTPTVITPDVNNKLKPTQLPGASTTASPTLGNESTVMRQSLNAEQGITPDSPTVVPTPDILTPVEESNVPNNVTTKAQPQPSILDLSNNVTAQTQTTQPSQPSQHKPIAETSQQIPPITPTVITPDVNNNSQPTSIPGVSTTAPPSLGNESTLMRHSLNAEQEIAANSPTVVPTPETLTPVAASVLPNNVTIETQTTQSFQPSVSDVPNNSTTQTQTTLRSQPNVDNTSTSTSQQIPPITPTVIAPDVNNNSQSTSIPGVSTTTPSTLGDESTLVQQDLMRDFLNESSPKNPSFDNLPAPTGFATGGQVATTQFQGSQSIAPSDTVPAMLTPGEFVINAQDTQKNLNLLEHINSGGRPENFISPKEILNSQDEGKSALAPDHSIHTDYSNESLIQRESFDATLPTTSHALISSSIGQEIVGRQSLSRPTFIQAYTKENSIRKVEKHSDQYSLPNLVFQQSTPATNSPSETAPSQWSSVEELLGASTNQSTGIDSEHVKFSRENSKLPTVSKSPKTTIQRKSVLKGFGNKEKVAATDKITSSNEAIPSDIDTEAQPVTETIKSFRCSLPTKDKIADEIETLAREIYNRLRQRLEIERERHGNGIYSGRLPW